MHDETQNWEGRFFCGFFFLKKSLSNKVVGQSLGKTQEARKSGRQEEKRKTEHEMDGLGEGSPRLAFARPSGGPLSGILLVDA